MFNIIKQYGIKHEYIMSDWADFKKNQAEFWK